MLQLARYCVCFLKMKIIEIEKKPQDVWARLKNLKSPNPTCRRIGCQDYVPCYGGYPGMPQAHCYRCGMITSNAVAFCEDFVEPIEPEIYLFDRIMNWFNN